MRSAHAAPRNKPAQHDGLVAAIAEAVIQRLGTAGAEPRAETAPYVWMPEACRIRGCSRQHLYREIGKGRFPQPVKVGAHRIGFLRAEIEAWMASRPRALGDAERDARRERFARKPRNQKRRMSVRTGADR